MDRSELKEFSDEQAKNRRRMLTKTQQPKIVLSVLDTGVGMKIKDQMKLFKLFGTVKSTKELNIRGVGLGLSISRMICEEFDGCVAVHSKKGIGSVF